MRENTEQIRKNSEKKQNTLELGKNRKLQRRLKK